MILNETADKRHNNRTNYSSISAECKVKFEIIIEDDELVLAIFFKDEKNKGCSMARHSMNFLYYETQKALPT